MHIYYHSEGVTDLDAIRKEAMYRLIDKVHPEESFVHLHPKDEVCKVTAYLTTVEKLAADQEHEWILFSRIDPNFTHPKTGMNTWKK